MARDSEPSAESKDPLQLSVTRDSSKSFYHETGLRRENSLLNRFLILARWDPSTTLPSAIANGNSAQDDNG